MLTAAELEARKRLDLINFALTKAAWELERAHFFRPQTFAVSDETDESAQSISSSDSGAAAATTASASANAVSTTARLATSEPAAAWHEEAKES